MNDIKRFFFFLGLITCLNFCNDLQSNPIIIPPPQAFISELFFETSDNWVLELELFIHPMIVVNGAIDSIVFQSNMSRARLLNFPEENYALFTVTEVDLSNPFFIDITEDTLRVITYSDSTLYNSDTISIHMLVYGYPYCEIPLFLTGQSVCSREREHGNPLYFYLDNSPTLGAENDTVDAMVTLTGNFYDYRDSLICYTLYNYDFALPVNVELFTGGYPPEDFYSALDVFTFNQEGNYITSLLSRNTSVNNIYYLFAGNAPEGYAYYEPLSCEDFSFFLEPGETKSQDIHLTDESFLVGVNNSKSKQYEDISIICAPNPVSRYGKFMITSEHPLEKAEILVYSSNGTFVLRLDVPNAGKCTISFNRDRLGIPGLYFFTLLQDKKPVKSGEFICL